MNGRASTQEPTTTSFWFLYCLSITPAGRAGIFNCLRLCSSCAGCRESRTKRWNGLALSSVFLMSFIVVHAVGNLVVFKGPDDCNGGSYFHVRLYAVEVYVRLIALLLIFVGFESLNTQDKVKRHMAVSVRLFQGVMATCHPPGIADSSFGTETSHTLLLPNYKDDEAMFGEARANLVRSRSAEMCWPWTLARA